MYIYAITIALFFLFFIFLKPAEKTVCIENGVLGISKVTNKSFLFFSCSLLLLLLGLRGVNVGSDTIQYNYHYLTDEITGFNMASLNLEVGFQWLENTCRKLGISWQLFLFIQAIIIMVPVGILINKFSVNPYLSILIYFTFGLFTVNISGGRQSISIALIMIGLCKLYDNKRWWFLICVAIAFLFHYSSIIGLLLFPFPKFKFKNNGQLLIWLLLPVAFRLLGDYLLLPLYNYLPGRYLSYFEDDINSMSLIKEVVIIGILLFCYFGLKLNRKKITDFDYQMFACLSLFVAFEELSFSVFMAARLAFYFRFAFVLLIPSVINKISDINTRAFISVSIASLFVIAFFVIAKDTPYENYYFFWQGR